MLNIKMGAGASTGSLYECVQLNNSNQTWHLGLQFSGKNQYVCNLIKMYTQNLWRQKLLHI